MNNNNYYQQCAEFLRDSYGIVKGSEVATELSRAAFVTGDLTSHFHWKFVLDYLERIKDEGWKIPPPQAFESSSAIH